MKKNLGFAYIQNLRVPSEKAHSVYIVKVCEAAQKLGAHTVCILPRRKQPSYFTHTSLWDYYGIPKGSFKMQRINSPSLLELPVLVEAIIGWFKHQLATLLFALKSWAYCLRNKTEIIETSDIEVAIVFVLLSLFYHPKIILDIHIDPSDKSIFNYFYKKIDLLVVNCIYYKEFFLKRGIKAENIFVAPNGFDPKNYFSKKSKLTLRKKINLPENRFIVGYIGRFETMGVEKGVYKLIKVASNIKNKSPEIPLTIVAVGGPEELKIQYQEYAAKLGLNESEYLIHSQVNPNQVSDYIFSFDVAWMVYPDNERFRNRISPMKAIEYVAAGKPVIASNFPSITQLKESKFMHLVDPENENELVDAVVSVYQNYDKEMKVMKRAKSRILDYSWEKRQKKIFKSVNASV